MGRRVIPNGQVCGYCGNTIDKHNATREHVIPRCLFPPDYRHTPIVIWACRTCNTTKAALDDYFRDTLITELGTDASHVPAWVMANFENSDSRNQSRVGRFARATGRLEPAFTVEGDFRGMGLAYEGEPERLLESSEFIARGLYFDKYKRVLPLNHQIHAGLLTPEAFLERVAFLGRYGVKS